VQLIAVTSIAALLAFTLVPALSAALDVAKIAGFDADEFEHSHSAWCVAQGQLPYRDFFQHHTPLFYYQLAAIHARLRPEQSFDAAVQTLLRSRQLIWVWTCLLLTELILLGVAWRGGRRGWATGLIAASLLSTVGMFWDKVLEIRPDGPAVALVLGGVLCFCFSASDRPQRAAKSHARRWPARLATLGGGGLISLALLHTQKVIFLGPGFAFYWLIFLGSRPSHLSTRDQWTHALLAVLGVVVPAIGALAWFAVEHGAREFLWFNLGFNFAWKHRFSPVDSIVGLCRAHPAFVFLGLSGMAAHLLASIVKRPLDLRTVLLLATTVSGLEGLFLIQAPYHQYHQLFLPFVALFAADGLLSTLLQIIRLAMVRTRCEGRGVGRASTGAPSHSRDTWSQPLAITLACVLGLGATSMEDSYQVMAGSTNTDQLEHVRWVMENTEPSDQVFNRWPPYAAFRPHAWFYWSHPFQMLDMIAAEEQRQFVSDVLEARIKPSVVEWGYFVDNLPREFREYIRVNYRPAFGSYWIRREEADSRPPH
jgi:hypothetical protein